MTETKVKFADRWDDMLFGVRRSIRYHQRRRAFFDRLDQFSNMLSVIFGSAAIYGVLEKNAFVGNVNWDKKEIMFFKKTKN